MPRTAADNPPHQQARCELSVVIPAYNEVERLPAALDVVVTHLSSRTYPWEVVIADDGSDDGTAEIVMRRAATRPEIRLLRLEHRGKAAAVHAGVRAAKGRFVLFTDADLSTPIAYVDPALDRLREDWDVVIGSREGAGARRLGEPGYRHVMGRLYNYIVQALVVPGIRDTQCGFKAFRAEVASDIFDSARLYRDHPSSVQGPLVTGFDVELLFLARKRGYRIFELPVTWRHHEGSKVRPGVDSLRMLGDALRVRLNDLRGRYEREPAARR